MDEGAIMAHIMQAQLTASDAVNKITTHEQVCAERYDGIKQRLTGIPRLFELLEGNKKEISDDIKSLSKIVYMGMGVALSIMSIIEILRYFGK